MRFTRGVHARLTFAWTLAVCVVVGIHDALGDSPAVTPVTSAAPASRPTTAAQPENEFPVTLGSFATTLIGSLPARTVNVRLAAEALEGLVLEPGDVLSFNRVVGPRTRERGYQMAPVILRESRQLQAGGGVCQVSSTLFMAALLSGLAVEERYRHSSPVDYIPLGEDATIAWGVKDLKVRNDLEQRVRLRVEVVGSTLAAHLEGEQPLAEAYEVATEEREIPGDPGVGSLPGREIEVYRVRRSGGEELGREFLFRDRYPPARSVESWGAR
jgi:vancomycin resistance protein YoaR